MEKISLLFIINQLRLHDNPLWAKAFSLGLPILPVWISPDFNKRHIHIPYPGMGGFRKRFLAESYFFLKEEIQNLDGALWVLPENFVHFPDGRFWKEIQKVFCIQHIIFPDEPGYYEEERKEEIRIIAENHQITVHFLDCNSLIPKREIQSRFLKFPSVFTEFRKKLEEDKNFPVREEIPKVSSDRFRELDLVKGKFPWLDEVSLEEEGKLQEYVDNSYLPDSRRVLGFRGGEKQGISRIDEYFWKKDLLKSYKETRNGLLGGDYSSKFSPWLANGSLSPVRIYNEILRYEKERIANESTYWLKFELMWREFFRWIVRENGKKVFSYSGIRGKTPHGLEKDMEKFEMWRLGQTGDDFVDANMRELLLTGYMSNRGRQNVASFFVHKLNLDWRWGAEWFETQLIDYDVSSNWGNWNYVAGVGNDPRNRVFNTTKQANDYDPGGEYRKFWLDTDPMPE